jgi:hypothetical protein
MANISRGSLRAYAVNLATTQGMSGMIAIIDPKPDEKQIRNFEKDEGDGWLSRWKVKALGWIALIGFAIANPMAFFTTIVVPWVFTKGLALLWRTWADNIENFHNFNWNITDEELDANWNSAMQQLGGQLGGTFGNLAGSLFGTGITTATQWGVTKLIKFNEGMAVRLLKEQGEEALDELFDNLRSLTQTVKQLALQALAVNAFKSSRRLLKWIVKDPNSDYVRGLNMLFGEGTINNIRKWGEKGSKPWSFAIAKEEEYDVIAKKSKFWANFWEEYDEEFREGMANSFYIAASVLEQSAVENEMLLGPTRAVEVYPNRQIRTEKIILAGNESLLKPLILSTIQNERRMSRRNVGMILGQPLETSIGTNLRGIDTKQIDLIIRYHDRKQPPFTKHGKRIFDQIVIVPNVERMRIDDWELVKRQAGGSNGYMGGGIKVVASLGNKDGLESDRIAVMAATEEEGIKLIEDLMQLTELEILGFHPVTQSKKGMKGRWNWIDPVKAYPIELTIVNYERVIREQEGKKPPSGTYKKDKYLFPLWTDVQPQGYAKNVQQLLLRND